MKNINLNLADAIEDYLETHLILYPKASFVWPIESTRLKALSKITVFLTIFTLLKIGYIQKMHQHLLSHTKKVVKVAQNIFRKFKLLLGFFTNQVSVSNSILRNPVYRIEYTIGSIITNKIRNFFINTRLLEVKAEHRSYISNLYRASSLFFKQLKWNFFTLQS